MKFAPLTFLTIMLLVVGCDTARDARKSRFNYSPFNSGTGTTGGNQTSGGDGGINIGDGGTNTGGGGGVTIPTEINHCSWATDGLNGFADNSNHLGQYTACKSSALETDIYFQIKNPITSVQVCFIPMSVSGSSSVYIGEPRCIVPNDNKRVYKVNMIKNRPNFSHLPLNGVMIMKDESHFFPYPFNQNALSPDAFIFCSNYLALYGSNPNYCEAFVSVGAYAFKQF